MPATSGSPTQQSTSVPNVATLESIEVDQFETGDLATVQGTSGSAPVASTTYQLDTESVTARNGSTVLYTRNTNPAYTPSATPATPGRWLRTNITAPI